MGLFTRETREKTASDLSPTTTATEPVAVGTGTGTGTEKSETSPREAGQAEANQHAVYVADTDGESTGGAGTFFKGGTQRHLSLFDKKAALINHEVDKFGMGKYQICIWFLAGFGYFLDLAWAQGVGILGTAIFTEMGVPNDRVGLLATLSNAGLAIGALSFGLIVDIIGRKWAFNLTCLITSIFGTLIAAPRYNYEAICGIYFLACIGLGGNIPIDALVALEFLPQNRRNLVSLLSLWQPVGVVFASVIAYAFASPNFRCSPLLPSCRAPGLEAGAECCTVASNMGWRYTLIVLGAVTLFIFFLRFFVFTFHESPKYLLSRGREQEAIDVLHRIAKFNKAPPPTLTVQDFMAVEQAHTGGVEPARKAEPSKNAIKRVLVNAWRSFAHLKLLFGNRLQLFIFILLAITYMGDYWSFNLAGYFLPIILFQFNTSDGRDGSVQDTYKQYIWIYLPGIAGAVFALLSVQLPLIGRKWSLVLSACLQGLAMAMYTQVRSTEGYVGLNAFAYIMQTYFNAVLYASAPELFDTGIRGSASGMLSCLGRLAGIVAPIAGQRYLDPESGSSTVLWLGAGGIWLAAITMVFLPVEMRTRQMY